MRGGLMRRDIFDSYLKDGWHIFPLHKVQNGKGNAVKGKYGTPTAWNDTSIKYEYNSKSIYGGVPPKDIVVLDWDIKKGGVGAVSFDKLQSAVGKTIDTVVETPSGGGHAYCRLSNLPEETPKLKKKQVKYPDIDFQSHESEFVVLGGQEIDGYGSYTFADEDFEYFVNTGIDFTNFELRAPRQMGDGYDSVDELEHIMLRPSEEEVLEILDDLNPDMGHDDGWQKVIMALNSWDLNGPRGLELAIEWSQRATKYQATEEEITSKYHACIADSPAFYNKLFTLRKTTVAGGFKPRIESCSSQEELLELAKEVGTSSLGREAREAFTDDFVKKNEDLGNKPERVKFKNLLKNSSGEGKEVKIPEGDFAVYRLDNKYLVRYENKIVQEVTSTMLKEVLASFGINLGKDEMARYKSIVPTISGYKQVPDYTLDGNMSFGLEEQGGIHLPAFVVRFNPLYDFEEKELCQDIIDDFFDGVWNGKLYDIVKLVALTIKLKETKLNRLMVVAPSNAGKSEIFTMMNFQKITMQRLLNGMRGDKGVGSEIVEGVRRSGLLLIDESNKALEAEIKDMDKELHIDQFGKGGTQVLPLHFTALTSTHSNATRNNSDELYNRFLQVELSKKEMSHLVTEGKLYLEDTAKYTDTITSKLLQLFKETLLNDEGKKELRELQERYRLPLNNDLTELLYEIGEDFIIETKGTAKEHGDVVVRAGEYFVKRKSDPTTYFENRLSEIENLDVGKYSELLSKHFVTEERKSIKVNGKPTKYYKLDLQSYTEDDEQKVLSQFDDLDIEDL